MKISINVYAIVMAGTFELYDGSRETIAKKFVTNQRNAEVLICLIQDI
jgi:hypothetical protein